MVALLDLLRCSKDLNLSSLKDKDWKNIRCLVSALVDKEPVEHLQNDLPPVIVMDVGELKFIVHLQKLKGETAHTIYLTFLKPKYQSCMKMMLAKCCQFLSM